MANSDYETRGTGLICPTADIINSIGPAATTFTITNYSSLSGLLVPVGGGALVDDEYMKIIAISLTSITVERGCADTIPQPHGANATIWFFDDVVASDQREYMATETIGVKVLMQTSGGTQAPKVAPALPVVFNSRFARPYPPARAAVGGDLFYNAPVLQFTNASHPDAVFTWNHRNRVIQADILIAYLATSITPEVGQGYRLRFTKEGVTMGSIDAGTGTSFTLTYAAARAVLNIGASDPIKDCMVYLYTVRDGFDSRYGIPFALRVGPDVVAGWGNLWGAAWGN